MRIKVTLAILTLLSCVMLLHPLVVHAYDPFRGTGGVCNSANSKEVSSSTACASPTTANPLLGSNGLFVKATHILAIIAGAAAIIVIIVAGLQYITSGGDAKNVSNAKNTILYALIGLVVIITAQTIISFALSKL